MLLARRCVSPVCKHFLWFATVHRESRPIASESQIRRLSCPSTSSAPLCHDAPHDHGSITQDNKPRDPHDGLPVPATAFLEC